MFQDRALHEAAKEARTQMNAARPRLAATNRIFTAIGNEMGGILLIALALAILCAPVSFGVTLTWSVWLAVDALTGSHALAWIAAIAVFAFLCRYVWGTRLQSAARRAAAALLAR